MSELTERPEIPTVTNVPTEIWLVIGELEGEDVDFRDLATGEDLTWCEEKQFDGDIKYVVASELDRQAKEIAELRAALNASVEVIKTWHNMDGSESVWPIYYRSSPEMKPIRDALGKDAP